MNIEKGVFFPGSLKKKEDWGFLEDMQVGDSVLDADARIASTKDSLVYSAMVNKARKLKWKVSGKAVDGGVRIWRVS